MKKRPIRALILTPTRELALQIQESFEAYGKYLSVRSAVIFGGVGQQPQVDKLSGGTDILVATPGRLLDLYTQGFIHVEKLEVFVLDEADRMLDMGFIHDVRKILSWLPEKKQTLFFSATMPPEVQGLVDSLLHDPVRVAVNPVSSPVEAIRQQLYYVDRSNKSKLLAQLIRKPEVKNALVFTRTKHGANKVAGDLMKAGIPAAAIHGNKSQTARQQALSDFKAGRIKTLVATDIAARGIDIEALSHVFNYNLPDVPETYVHRIGRTGRAGHGGTAVSFCEFGEKELLAPIEALLKKPIPVVEAHDFPLSNFEVPKRDKHGRIVNADDAEARQAARERKRNRQEQAQVQPPFTKPLPEDRAAPGPQKASPSLTGQPFGKRYRTEEDAHPKSAQTTASGKRFSAGYKASRTLEEALHAMDPKWTEEEKRVQTTQYSRDPLAGEVVMDATARLLAPRKRAENPPDRREPRPEGRKGAAAQNRQERRKNAGKPASGAAEKLEHNRKGAARKAAPHVPDHREKTGPRRRNDPSGRGRRPMEPVLRLGSQKDSTEQRGSLMKPYYFNPNGD